jgi:hypothetical protein
MKEEKNKKNNEVIKQDFNLEQLISQGITKGLPIETMKELLAMRKELKDEWAKEQYFKSLSTFQSLCPIIKKDKEVLNKDGKTKRYSYAPLEVIITQVKDILKDCGFSYTLNSRQENNEYISICIIHHKDGHSEQSEFRLPLEDSQYMSSIQRVGSTRTYANRYCFCNAFGIVTEDEDDDGNIIEDEIINNNPACPNCLHNFKVIKSKFPGKEWYCLECKKGFDEEKNETSKKENNQQQGLEKKEIEGKEQKEQKEEILAMARLKTEQIKADGKVQYFIDLSKSKDDYSEDQYLLDLQYLQGLEKEPEFNDEHMQKGIFDKFKNKAKE